MTAGASAVGESVFDVEQTFNINTGQFRSSIPLQQVQKIKMLRNLFAKVELLDLVVEVRQDTLVGDSEGELKPLGHVYVAIIPSSMDTDAQTGAAKATIDNVPFKQTFPLSSSEQANMIFKPNLGGYELDLAQDPRRGAGPVAWLGNSGVKKSGKEHAYICTSTWRLKVRCSGSSPLWF